MTEFELSFDQAKAIEQAVTWLPGIAGLDGGSYGEVSLLYPGERIAGIRRPQVDDDTHLEIHIVVDLSAPNALKDAAPLSDCAPQVREAVHAVCPEVTTVDVIIADVRGPQTGGAQG